MLHYFSIFLSLFVVLSAARQCTKDDYIFEYTECKPDGSRWRVSVPKTDGACSKGEPPSPPIKGQPCDFTCGAGQYLQKEGDQECHQCPAGEYSLGGGIRYNQWDTIPKEFSQKVSHSVEFEEEMGEGEPNCTGTKWVPRGSYVEAVGEDCSAVLILNVELIKKGKLTFKYQFPSSEALFKVSTTSDQCVSGNGPDDSLDDDDDVGEGSDYKYLEPNEEGDDEWKTEELSLPPGKNQLTLSVFFFGMAYDADMKDRTIKIRLIEIQGIAYSSSCSPCLPGTYSEEGSSICNNCPADTYASQKKATKCPPCNKTTHYALKGAANCTWRKPCTKLDYFVTHTPCDEKGQTRMMYRWVEPRVCRFDIKGSVSLPPSGDPQKCPPCNPGMTSVNVTDNGCKYCPVGYYGNGSDACKQCPRGTEPDYSITMKFFHALPRNVYVSCLDGDYSRDGCAGANGWVLHGDYVGTEPENDVNAGAKLTVWTRGFRGAEGVVQGKPGVTGQLQFVFEMICSEDCQFTLSEAVDFGAPKEVDSWAGTHEKQRYVYDVTRSGQTEFIWQFQRSKTHYYSYEKNNALSSLPTGELRIYFLNLTNSADGGAASCSDCLTGETMGHGQNSLCRGCDAGNYFDKTLKKCFPCPENTYINVMNPVGKDSCLPCGPGTKSHKGSTYCYSDCTFIDSKGRHYNFSSLGALTVNVSSASLFTRSGSRYFHQYTLDICGEGKEAFCNASIGISSKIFSSLDRPNYVQSYSCKLTTMPHVNGTLLTADPMSLGDQLLAVIDEESAGNLTRKDFIEPDEINGTVITFFYQGSRATSACAGGRSAVVSLHCNPNEEGFGKVSLPKSCPDGTCDGCIYGFIWHTQLACPLCRTDDYEKIETCDHTDNLTHMYYMWKQPKLCYGGVTIPPKTILGNCSDVKIVIKTVIVPGESKSSIMDYKVYIAIGLGVFFLLVTVLIVLWYKNRSLEYKYQKLVQSSNPGDELPAPETCGQDTEEEEEVVFDKRPGRGKTFLKKIKSLAGKKDDDQYFDTIKLEPMSTST